VSLPCVVEILSKGVVVGNCHNPSARSARSAQLMLQELEEIAEEHEESSPSSALSPSSSSASRKRIVGILEVEAKGKTLKLKIRKGVRAEDLVHKFLNENNLPQKFTQPLLLKVLKMLQDGESLAGSSPPFSLTHSSFCS
jgi:hypothetical protein